MIVNKIFIELQPDDSTGARVVGEEQEETKSSESSYENQIKAFRMRIDRGVDWCLSSLRLKFVECD